MTVRGVDFLELWIERNVLPRAAGEDQATRLALKLANDATVEGLKFEELEIDGDAQTFIRDVIVHVGEPGMPRIDIPIEALNCSTSIHTQQFSMKRFRDLLAPGSYERVLPVD